MVFISTLFLCQELYLQVLIRSRQYRHVHPHYNHLQFDSTPKTKTTPTAHNFSIFMDHVSSALPPSFKSSQVSRQVNRSIQVHAESYCVSSFFKLVHFNFRHSGLFLSLSSFSELPSCITGLCGSLRQLFGLIGSILTNINERN